MNTYAAIIVGLCCLILFWLTGCGDLYRDWDLPQQCKGSLQSVRDKVTVPYRVVHTPMGQGRWGMTVRLEKDGPALIYIDSTLGRLNREMTEQHELCHLVVGQFHAEPPPTKGNVSPPDRGAMWDRQKMGAPN